MSELKFKAYGELEISEALSDASHVIIEENGDVKRFPANSIGKVKTVNGVEPDESGNVAVEIPAPVQPDLSQNDPEAPDYIKGKVFEAVALDLTFEFDSSEDNPNYLPELKWCLVTDKITDPSQINGASIVAGEYNAEIERTLVSNPVTVDGSGWYFIEDIYYEKSVMVYFPAANISAGLLLAIMPKDTATQDGLSIVKAGLYVQNYNKRKFVRTFEQALCTKPLDSKYISTTVPAISTASVGQTIVVKSVDDTGKPTEWEAVDMPKDFVVTVFTDDSGNPSADRTFDEVLSAHKDGKDVVLKSDFEGDTAIYRLSEITATVAIFSRTILAGTVDNADVILTQVHLSADGITVMTRSIPKTT